jgi:hypothetical protein
MWEKLEPERPGRERGDSDQLAKYAESDDTVGEGKLKHRPIDAPQRADDGSFSLPNALRLKHGAEHRRNGKGCDER